MRKSQARAGSRGLRAGVAAAVATVAVVAGTGTAAFAADEAVTLAQTTVPSAGGATVTLEGEGVFTADFYARWVLSTTTCALTYPATSTSSTAPVVDGGQVDADVSTDSATLTTPALTAAKEWKVCLYVSNTANSSAIAGHSTNTALSVPYAALSQAAGPTGGGNTITLTGTGFLPSSLTTATTFNTATCPNKYAATSGTTNIAATSSRTAAGTATITVPATIAARTPYNVCVYNGTTVNTSALQGKSAGTYTALASGTLSPTAGNSGGTNTITLSTTTNTIAGDLPAATFTTGTCPAEYEVGSGEAPFASPLVTKISSAKVAIEVPAGVEVAEDAATTAWKVCLYASDSGSLLTIPPTYTVAPVLEVGSASLGSVTGGPAQGGTRITVSGLTGIPEAAGALLTASLGGAALTDIEVIDDTSFSATTSARGAGAVALSVTTAAGTDSSNGNVFTYSYGITVTPNVAAPATTPTLDVMGAGFLAIANNFANYDVSGGTTPAATKSHVLLVNNTWYSNKPGAVTAIAVNAPTTQCKNVTVISDNELICQLDLTNTLDTSGYVQTADVTQGSYQIVVVNDASGVATGTYSIVSSGSTFTVANF